MLADVFVETQRKGQPLSKTFYEYVCRPVSSNHRIGCVGDLGQLGVQHLSQGYFGMHTGASRNLTINLPIDR